jgi:hypothetical protein
MYSQGGIELANQLNRQLELWQRIQGSAPARVAVNNEEQQEQSQ